MKVKIYTTENPYKKMYDLLKTENPNIEQMIGKKFFYNDTEMDEHTEGLLLSETDENAYWPHNESVEIAPDQILINTCSGAIYIVESDGYRYEGGARGCMTHEKLALFLYELTDYRKTIQQSKVESFWGVMDVEDYVLKQILNWENNPETQNRWTSSHAGFVGIIRVYLHNCLEKG